MSKIDERTSILYEAFYLLHAISENFNPPLTVNEKHAYSLFERWDRLTYKEGLDLVKNHEELKVIQDNELQ